MHMKTVVSVVSFAAVFSVFAADRYVSTTGSDSADGSQGAPFTTLTRAIADLGSDGGTIHVAPGTYLSTSGTEASGLGTSAYEITAPVEIIGEGDDPSKTVFRRESGTLRLFYINNASAKLKNLTVDNGKQSIPDNKNYPGDNGGNIYMDAEGGTIEDCIISNGYAAHWNGGGGNIYMAGGRVIRCKITGGSCDNDRDPSTSDFQYGAAIMATGGVIENCLITGNGRHASASQHGSCPVNLLNEAKMVNCTVAGNFGVYCAGVYVQRSKNVTAMPVVKNCAIFNNSATTDKTGHSADWLTQNDACKAAFIGCACVSEINETCVVMASGGFCDPNAGDFHLSCVSGCRDAAEPESAAISATDLDGNQRVIGAKQDIGCYEFDPTEFTCGFTVDKSAGLVPCVVTFTAGCSGTGVSDPLYRWDFDGDGDFDVSTYDEVISYEYVEVGTFSVRLCVTAGGEDAYAEQTDCLSLGPGHIYVRPDSEGGVAPYITPETAAKDLKTAYGVAVDGSVIHLAPGLYEQNSGSRVATIERAVTIIGDDGDPANTVLRNTGSPSTYADSSVIKLSHPDAVLANVTLKDGCSRNVGSIGSSATILSGGTITNCIITGGQQLYNQSAPTAGVFMQAGLLTHSILEGFETPLLSKENGYGDSPNSRVAQALAMSGAATVENCLFRNNRSDGPIVVMSHADAVMRNCTFVNCEVSFWTDNPVVPSAKASADDPRRQHPTACVDCEKGNGKIYNTAFFNVSRREYHDIVGGTNCPAVASAPFTYNSNNAILGDTDDDKRHCFNCATDTDAPLNSTCFTMTASDFADYESGDYRPVLRGALFDHGADIPGWSKITDLAGKPRIARKAIDIGCYELQPLPGFSVMLR